MRRDTTQPYTFWSARIDQESKETFNNLIPIHGAQSWVIDSALEKFLDIVETSKEMKDNIDGMIQRHLYEEERAGRTIEFGIKIRTGLYERFNDLFPGRGATSWFIRVIIVAVNTQLSDFILDERVQAAVRSIIREQTDDEKEERSEASETENTTGFGA